MFDSIDFNKHKIYLGFILLKAHRGIMQKQLHILKYLLNCFWVANASSYKSVMKKVHS